MKHRFKIQWTFLPLALGFIFFFATIAIAGQITLVGEVNDNYQLVADGQIYEIADTPMGNELAENFISSKVKVTGTVEEKSDIKTLTVEKFEVVTE